MQLSKTSVYLACCAMAQHARSRTFGRRNLYAAKAVRKKNGIMAIGTFYNDRNNLYLPRNEHLTHFVLASFEFGTSCKLNLQEKSWQTVLLRDR